MNILSDDKQMMIVSDVSYAIRQQVENHRMTLPPLAVSYGAKLSKDGDMWCFLYGDNLQDGVAGFGKSVAAAADDFEKNWFKS